MDFLVAWYIGLAIAAILRALWASVALKRHIGWFPAAGVLGVTAFIVWAEALPPALVIDILFQGVVLVAIGGEFWYHCIAKPPPETSPAWRRKFAPGDVWLQGLSSRRSG